ncbi:MAG: hypothetical protein R3E86_10235 [Pseudomonadales bacterium]
MSVEFLDTERFYGYRVRRQVAGRAYQEYFPLNDGGRRLRGAERARVRARARARDAELAERQKIDQARRARIVQIGASGRVRGIQCRSKTEKSGNRTPVFQIGIMSLVERRVVSTTVSINRYGVAGAWRRAVDFYARHKQIGLRSDAYRALLAAQPSSAQVRAVLEQVVPLPTRT